MSEITTEAISGPGRSQSPQTLEWIRETIELAERCFRTETRPTLAHEQDPESDAEWFLIDVAVQRGSGDALEFYRRFIAQWIKQMPPEARSLIHVTFHVV
jgi:hypothetical protein